MHEMSLCEGVLQIIESEAAKQNFTQVKRVILEVGTLSGVEIKALEFAFDVVMKGSIAEQARLEIIELEAQAWCMQCAKSVTIKQRYDACPTCGSYQLQVSSGDEMRIKELEVD
ncbi:MAG TPA: hydrogenase maturation nickel metallochaperone HypA [Gammaproteobacteria bacterium]|nr:hydrogenase maturation nickel metallochaperone HypA [Gammaproteobacteria bacterium]